MDRDKLDALERLAALKSSGALTEAEFEAQKSQLLETSGTTLRPSSTAGDALEDSVEEPSYTAVPPSWDRPKRRSSVPAAVWAILVLLVVGAATAFYWPRADDETYSFLVTGSANVRDAPTSDGSVVVGQMAEGDSFLGRVRGSGDEQWVEITDGPLAGGFVWEGNLVVEGPDNPLADYGGPEPESAALPDVSPELAQIMRANAVRGTPWRSVEEVDERHLGGYGNCTTREAFFLVAPEAAGFLVNGEIVTAQPFTEIYRAGNRYIWSTGRGYSVADFLPNEMIMRDAEGNPGDRATKCAGMPMEGAQGPVTRADLFTARGLSEPQNFQRADCSDVIAARYVLTCAATILNGMPNAAALPQVRQNLASAEQESARRCSAQSNRVGAAGDAVVQQQIGQVYQTVAGHAVYGGDISDIAISECARSVVGSLAGAGLIR